MTGFRVSRAVGPARPGRRRPVHLRQGHGWRAARGRLRRPCRGHGAARPGRAGLPGGHALRQPTRLRRGAGHAAAGRRRALPRLDEPAATVGRLAAEALTAAGVPHRLSYAGNMFSIFFTDADVVDYDSARRPGRRGVQGVLPRDAGRRRLPAAERVRGVVRVGGAGRRRPGAVRGGAARRRRGAAAGRRGVGG